MWDVTSPWVPITLILTVMLIAMAAFPKPTATRAPITMPAYCLEADGESFAPCDAPWLNTEREV